MITSSLEWPKKETALRRRAMNLNQYPDIMKMLNSITEEVSQLSKAEVLVRQGRKHAAEEILVKVNQDIELVEEYILVAALLG
jgi:hypothetical protein